MPDPRRAENRLSGAAGRRAARPHRRAYLPRLTGRRGRGGARLELADPAAGLLITVAILAVLRQAAREIYRRLVDAVDPALTGQAEQTLHLTPGVLDTGQVRLRWIHHLRAEYEVITDPDITAIQAHQIAVSAEHNLLHAIPRLAAALVHADPSPTMAPATTTSSPPTIKHSLQPLPTRAATCRRANPQTCAASRPAHSHPGARREPREPSARADRWPAARLCGRTGGNALRPCGLTAS